MSEKPKPYHYIFVPADEGGFSASVYELPGCYSEGETLDEAYANLLDAMDGWIAAAEDTGQQVPEPFEDFPRAQQ